MTQEEMVAQAEAALIDENVRDHETPPNEEKNVDAAQWGNEPADIIKLFPPDRKEDYEIFMMMISKKMGIGFIDKSDISRFMGSFWAMQREWAHSIRGHKFDGVDRAFVKILETHYRMTLSGSIDGKERKLHFSTNKEISFTGPRAKKGFLSRWTGGGQ